MKWGKNLKELQKVTCITDEEQPKLLEHKSSDQPFLYADTMIVLKN